MSALKNQEQPMFPSAGRQHHSRRRRPLLLAVLLALSLVGMGAGVPAADTITLPSQQVAPGEVKLTINIALPPGNKLNDEAPSAVALSAGDDKVVKLIPKTFDKLAAAKLPLTLKLPVREGQTSITADFRINFCDDKVGLCFMQNATLVLPVEVSKKSANKDLTITYQVKSP
mgnify:CR=1 FL=1